MIPNWIQIAINELGTQEVEGSDSNPRIDEYLRSVKIQGNDEIPWCAAFVNWVLGEANLKATGTARARSFCAIGTKCHEKFGALAIFERGKDPLAGHVGFIMDTFKQKVYLLGGNQSNRVGIGMYQKSKLITCRWPE